MPFKVSRFQKNIFAALVLILLIWLVDTRELIAALSQLTLESIVLLLLISVLLVYISALKWQLILQYLKCSSSVFKLFSLYLLGYFVNLLFPSYVGGDVARSFFLGKDVGQHQAFSATIVERYTGLVAMIVLALVFMWFSEMASTPIKFVVVSCAAGLGIITLMVLSPGLLNRLQRIDKLKSINLHLLQVQEHLSSAIRNKSLMIKALAYSFLFHSFTVVNTVVAAYAVGCYQISVYELFVVMPLILLIGALPLAPSGLGLQEGAFVFFLSGIGVSPAQALGIGIVLRAKSYVLAIFGWFVWLRHKTAQD